MCVFVEFSEVLISFDGIPPPYLNIDCPQSMGRGLLGLELESLSSPSGSEASEFLMS